MNLNETIVSFLILVYNLILVAGTAYLVALHDWSMWTFLLTMCFMLTVRTSKEEKN